MSRTLPSDAAGGGSGGGAADIFSLIDRQAQIRGDAPALRSVDGPEIGYRELVRMVEALALRLRDHCGPADGRRPRIGLVMPNGPAMATSLLGAVAAGIAIPLNPSYRRSEFQSYLTTMHVDVLLVDDETPAAAIKAAEALSLPILHRSGQGGEGPASDGSSFRPPAPEDMALVLMTSGSTGVPKAVPLSHRNICHATAEICRSLELGSDDVCLSMWEQYHVGGLVDLLLAPLASGGTVCVTPGFDADLFFELLESQRPSWFQGVPTTLGELLKFARKRKALPIRNTLRFIRSVAAALPPDRLQELVDVFGVPVVRTFGMTEAAPLITSTGLTLDDRKPASVGSPCGCEVGILDPHGHPLEPTREGRVFVRGDNVFKGYENDPVSNAEHFHDGWFHTGDLGYLDSDGDLFLTGRTKQLINRGGEKVNPAEVEQVLMAHPLISDAAVFPVPHRTLGEEVAAAIVSATPPADEELKRHLEAHLTDFKIPRSIHPLDELPTNEIGKVDRGALTSRYSNEVHPVGPDGVPADDLERFLAAVWASELDAKELRVDDDFSRLGGDSLSALRVMVSVERAFDADFSRIIGRGLTTIRELAQRLRENDLVPDEIPHFGSVGNRSTSDDSGPHGSLVESDGVMASMTNLSEARMLAESMVSYATPQELGDLLSATSALPWSRVFFGMRGLIAGRRVLRWRVKWRRRMRRALRRARRDGELWRRAEIAQNAFLFQSDASSADTKRLIVAFTGDALRLMMPTYWVLGCLDPRRFDLLLLRDPSQKRYVEGIEGIGPDLDAVASFAAEFASDGSYRSVVTLGTSGGGLASVYVARANDWSKALAVGPSDPKEDKRLGRLLLEQEASAGHSTEVSVHFGMENERDRERSEALQTIVPGAVLKGHAGLSGHLVLHGLYERGELAEFFARELGEQGDSRSSVTRRLEQ